MNPEPRFPFCCVHRFVPPSTLDPGGACEAPRSGGSSSLAEGSERCVTGSRAPRPGSSRSGPTCGFWSSSTAASEWRVPPQLSLPGVHAIGADELGELREDFPTLVELLAEGRDLHSPGYASSGSSLVDGPRVHETDPRLNTGRNFGHHVRSLRRARGMTQEVLADRSALSADTIRRLEHGSFSPSLDTLRKLCVGLDLMLSTLFESYELGARNEARELLDLLATRTPRELALATRVLRALFDELDDMRGTSVAPIDDEDEPDEEPIDDDELPPSGDDDDDE
ncbi:helix-turn-helix domain-containing protein [Nannocystaceae bacterium ST9]